MHLNVPAGVSLESVGNGLVAFGLLTRISDILVHLNDGPNVTPGDVTAVTQLLTFLILLFGFAFAQIGRRQELADERRRRQDEKDENEARRASEKKEREERAEELARLLDAQADNVRVANEAAHKETLAKLDVNREAVQSAYQETSDNTRKIVDLQGQLTQTLATTGVVERTPNTVLTEVPIVTKE